MTLLWMDGFDLGDRAYKYPTNPGQGTSSNTRYGSGLSLQANSTGSLMSIPLTASAEVFCGVAVDLSTNRGAVTFQGDNRATSHITVMMYTDGSIEVRRGTSTGTIIASAPAGTVPAGVWNYYEMRVTISDTVGIVQVRTNGGTTNVIDFSGDTKNAGTNTTIDGVNLGVNGTTVCRYDDLYILNALGSAPNNTWLGDVRIAGLFATGNGNSSQLLGSDGNSTDNYLLVSGAGGVTDYVGSAVVGEKDTYVMGDLIAGATSVFAVQECSIVSKSDAGAANIKQVLRSGGTDYAGAAVPLTEAWFGIRRIHETNPATSVQWTPSGVNAIESGVEVA